MRGFLPKITATDGCFGSAIGSQMHTVDISANREISSQTTSISFDNETRELADVHCAARKDFYGDVVNSAECRDVKDGAKALWGSFKDDFPESRNSLCQVHGRRLLQAKAGSDEAAKYTAAVYSCPQTVLEKKKLRSVVTKTSPLIYDSLTVCLLLLILVESFNAKTNKVFVKFKDEQLVVLKYGDATGIATQNHAESFNKLMLDVRQLNPVLQLRSLVKRSCKRWNDECLRAKNARRFFLPG